MKRLTILGSTGSIGTQSLSVCETQQFQVDGLSANRNVALLEQQARKYRPEKVCIYDQSLYSDLKIKLADTNVTVLSGENGLCELAAVNRSDIVLNALVGMVGLHPTLQAIHAGKNIALANKETLVAGGELVQKTIMQQNVTVYPVDSEHSAIFQCMQNHGTFRCCHYQNLGDTTNKKGGMLNKLLLTASGGPFFGKTRNQLQHVTVEQALRHPNWTMGSKITIDSATLMNKGLELIEAVWLFGVLPQDIQILVHRESILHSAVQFHDFSIVGQLGVPDMKIPIQYALTYPERVGCDVKQLDLIEVGCLHFFPADEQTFTCLGACRAAIEKGGTTPAFINCVNEYAVDLFLKCKIAFLQIGELAMRAAQDYRPVYHYSYQDILQAQKQAQDFVLKYMG